VGDASAFFARDEERTKEGRVPKFSAFWPEWIARREEMESEMKRKRRGRPRRGNSLETAIAGGDEEHPETYYYQALSIPLDPREGKAQEEREI